MCSYGRGGAIVYMVTWGTHSAELLFVFQLGWGKLCDDPPPTLTNGGGSVWPGLPFESNLFGTARSEKALTCRIDTLLWLTLFALGLSVLESPHPFPHEVWKLPPLKHMFYMFKILIVLLSAEKCIIDIMPITVLSTRLYELCLLSFKLIWISLI